MVEPPQEKQLPSGSVTFAWVAGIVSPASLGKPSAYSVARHRTLVLRGKRLLTILSLFLKARDRRVDLLDCSDHTGSTAWRNTVHVVAAASVLDGVLGRAPESYSPHQVLEAPLTKVETETTLSRSVFDLLPALSVNSYLRSQFALLEKLFQGGWEGKKVSTAPVGDGRGGSHSHSSTSVLSDLLASSVRNARPPRTHGASRKPAETANAAGATGRNRLRSRPTVTGDRRPGETSSDKSVAIGLEMQQKAYKGLLESLRVPYLVSGDPEDLRDDGGWRQFRPVEPQAAQQGKEAAHASMGAFYPRAGLLRGELLLNASVPPAVVSSDTNFGKLSSDTQAGDVQRQGTDISRGLLLGILSCFIGAFCGSLGDNMVRRSFMLLQDKENITLFQMWRSPLWAIGMFLTIVVNTCCSIIGLAFAPATVVTSFAGVHIFWNTVLAKTLNREKATSYDYVGVVAVVLGIVLIVVYSGGNQAIQNYQAFGDNLWNIGPVLYILVVIILVTFATTFECCPDALRWSRDVSPGADEDWGRKASLAERFLLAATSGACGGLSNLLAKATVLMFNAAPFRGSNEESATKSTASAWVMRQGYLHLGWSACILLALTGAVAAVQLLFLNASLRKFEAIYVVPTINSVLIVMGALGGIVLFREVPAQYSSFALGVASVVVGVIALSYGKYEADQHSLQTRPQKETPVRAFSGTEPAAPLLQQPSTPQASLEVLRREEPASGERPQMRGWCEALFRPVEDASINILVRTNTLNTNYPAGLLNIAHFDSNADIRVLHQVSRELTSASERPEPPNNKGAPIT